MARRALREVREAVAGYRQPTLAAELAGARQMLAAAGIACRIEDQAGTLPVAVDATLESVRSMPAKLEKGPPASTRAMETRQSKSSSPALSGEIAISVVAPPPFFHGMLL